MKKKILILALSVLSLNLANAQAGKISTAVILMSDYNQDRSLSDLKAAQKNIDAAVQHENTIASGKAWYTRGLVYKLLSENQEIEPSNYNEVAIESFGKAFSLNDKKFRDGKRALDKLRELAANTFNGAIEMGNTKQFKEAYAQYQLVNKINEIVTTQGSKLTFDAFGAVINATFMADNAGMVKEAAEGYRAMIAKEADAKKKENYYLRLANLYAKHEDKENYAKVIDEAVVAFPNNANLLISQLNLLIKAGKKEEALTKIDKAIELQPDNDALYFVKAKSLDDAGQTEEAIKVYEQAIKINPKNEKAYYNLGAIYFLSANKYVEQLNALGTSAADNKRYEELIAERKAVYLKAKPLFEKVLELKPDDALAKDALNKINRRLD